MKVADKSILRHPPKTKKNQKIEWEDKESCSNSNETDVMLQYTKVYITTPLNF